MQDGGFNIGSLIDELAKRLAAHLLAALGQGFGSSVRPRLLTVEQAARYIGRSEEAMRHMISTGKIQVVRFDGRVFVDVPDLERLIEDSKTGGIR